MEVGSETLRTQADRIGTVEGEQRRVMTWGRSDARTARGRAVVETDGVLVRYRDRHLGGALVEGD